MPSTGNIVFTVLSVAIVVCLWLCCKDRGLPGFRRYKIMDVIYMIREYFPPCGLRPTARISGPCPVRVALVALALHSLPLCWPRCPCVGLVAVVLPLLRPCPPPSVPRPCSRKDPGMCGDISSGAFRGRGCRAGSPGVLPAGYVSCSPIPGRAAGVSGRSASGIRWALCP